MCRSVTAFNVSVRPDSRESVVKSTSTNALLNRVTTAVRVSIFRRDIVANARTALAESTAKRRNPTVETIRVPSEPCAKTNPV